MRGGVPEVHETGDAQREHRRERHQQVAHVHLGNRRVVRDVAKPAVAQNRQRRNPARVERALEVVQRGDGNRVDRDDRAPGPIPARAAPLRGLTLRTV